MSTASLSIDRTSLSLSALVIADDSTTYRLAKGGFGRPAMTWRTTFAPDSINVHGSEPIAAVKEQTSIPAEVIVLGATWAAVDTAVTALETAVSQFSYDVTQTTGGVARAWAASPASWSSASSTVEPFNVDQKFEVLRLTIPVYPISSTS